MTVGALDTSNKYFTFQDESPLPLCLSVIPVVGTVIQLMKEHSILTRFNKSDQQAEKVELMKTYKNYTYVSLARNVLILAGVITGLVLNIFVPIVGYIVFPILGLSLTIGLFKAAPSPERMVTVLSKNPDSKT